MAKRYKQSVKDRMAESRGMERYETKKKMKKKNSMKYASGGVGMKFSDEYYRGEDPGRRAERMAGEMIKEDHSEIANLPQQVVMKEYPKVDYLRYNSVEDTYKKDDRQHDHAVNFARKNKPDSMY